MERWNSGRELGTAPDGQERLQLSAALVLEITLGIIKKQSLNAILGCEIKPNFLFKLYL